jgi:cytochrome c oxidase subunit II
MNRIKSAFLAAGLLLTPIALANAQPAAAPVAAPVAAQPAPAVAAPKEVKLDAAAPAAKAAEAPATTIGTSKPDPLIGQPVPGQIGLQPQVTDIGDQAVFMHDYFLMPVMVVISLLVLALLGYVMVVFRRRANPNPSKVTHNTLLEVLWTGIPVLILLVIAVPSIRLLAAQYAPPPKDAVTLKAIGNQWYWVHDYPDHGVEITSNMMPDEEAKAKGLPRTLEVDNRIVLPVNTPIRLLTTANDVIHAWAIPAFWVKLDAVPGRINETSFTVNKTGVYYGQCSELCGIKHGFMPIAIEVVSKEDFATWVKAKGGTMPGEAPAEAAAAPAAPAAQAAEAAPAAAKN